MEGLIALFSLCHKVPIAVDALSDFICLGNLQKATVLFSGIKEAVFGILEGEAYGLKFLYSVLYYLSRS